MHSANALKRSVVRLTFAVLFICLAAGIFLVGFHVGRAGTLKTVSEVLQGERSADDLGKALPSTPPGDFSVRGKVVSRGSGKLTIENDAGRRTVLMDSQTKVRSSGALVPEGAVQTGDTLFILGKPEEPNTMDAKVVRILRP